MEVSMGHRLCTPIRVSALVIAVLILMTAAPVAGQVAPPAAKNAAGAKAWKQARTPDGQPDLQGVWTNATLTPLERPKEYAAKQFLSEEEAVEFAKKELNNVDGDRRDGGSDTDVNRAYNEFWRDRGQVTADRRTSLIIDPPDGRVPPLTAAAQKAAADRAAMNRGHQFDGPENRNLAERCISVTNAGPPMMPANYNANYQIVQATGYVALLSEQIHDVRVIPTDGRPHVSQNVRQLLGDSRGHWEGNTLVVETTNFTDRTAFRGSGEHLHLIERFTRTGADSMDYEFTMNDPESFTKPWTARIPMAKVAGPIYEYACNEGNYGLSGSLSGARAEEKRAEEAKKGSR
jgi:hypothetical protein